MTRRGDCPTGKTKFPDRPTASAELARIKATSNREKIPSRIYRCALCADWHLTSQPRRNP